VFLGLLPEQATDLLVRVFPLVFSLFLDVAPRDFLGKWVSTVDQTDQSELTFDVAKTKGFYKQVSIYVYDEYRTSYTVTLSLFYIGTLYVISVIQASVRPSEILAAVVAILFFALSPLSFVYLRAWYDPKERSPSRYHLYQVEESGEDQERIKERFQRFSNPTVDRYFSPLTLAIVVQILLILLVVIIQLMPSKYASISGLATAILIYVYIRMIFPKEIESESEEMT